MESKAHIVETLYKAVNAVILCENTENVREIKICKKQNGWYLTMTTGYELPLSKSLELSRKFYKNVSFKATKRLNKRAGKTTC